MADHAVSTDPAVQAQLDRLWALSPGADVLGLGRIGELLARLGDPHRRLPPVFHVAGTNGKGSTCAFLRAALEAAGYRVHAYTSPHLVRFNERIRLAGRLIEDDALAPLLAEVLDVAGGIGASFFEVTTAAAFLAFARTPADACVIEVGLGGRLDATNVVTPVACGIAQLGIDHEAFLLAPEAGVPQAPLARIAFEKAGIAKAGVPLVTQGYPAEMAAVIADVAHRQGARLVARGDAWDAADGSYRDGRGDLSLPAPALPGPHQRDNAALAVAMLRHQDALPVDDAALAAGIRGARWPARMQRLGEGPLTRRLPPSMRRVWLDGAHNESAARTIADGWAGAGGLAIVIGMLANKDAAGVLRALTGIGHPCDVVAVPVPGHACHDPATLAALALEFGARSSANAASVADAFDLLAATNDASTVLVVGTLYIAGQVLTANDELPD